MDKKELQNILSNAYKLESWQKVLIDIFNVKNIHQSPRIINNLPKNEDIKDAFELGSFYTVDERLIGIYQINLLARPNIERNKVGLRELLRNIYKYDVDAALIVFVQDEKWRFSYVSEIRTEEGKKETESKRYTYLFGEGESCRTATDRFDKLKSKSIYLTDLFEAFSVEKLNKDFFKSYKEYFEKFADHLAQSSIYRKYILGTDAELEKGWKDINAKPIRDFAKKLLGRIVFLQFLQKKGWMGVSSVQNDWTGGDVKFLQNLFLAYSDQEHFHSKALKTLFFDTLNRKRDNNIAPVAIGENIKIPYLNGGLFDKDISFDNAIDFPTELFKSLLDFFEAYNFTIDENDPFESEVGIDPEMLGHIFENLLEENREKGAFYTPKEIVHYMCQESLIEYLHTQLPNYNKTDFEFLIRNNQITETLAKHDVAKQVNDKLKAVKVCDPAIGSGAFPMGMLKEIYECRRLLYGYLKTNETFDPAIIKKEIIQQNIYGVDIENGAVEIARLRFWLALVVDEKVPQPLPNLDYKIMQGNSLLEQFANVDLRNLIDADNSISVEEKKQLTLFETENVQLTIFTQANKEHLFDLIKKYFDPDLWEKQNGEIIDKAKVKKEINNFVERKIHAHILTQKRHLQNDIQNIEIIWENAGIIDLQKLNHKTKEYKKYVNSKLKFEKIGEIESDLIALQKKEEKPYFLWHLWFKDVFDKGGFDIVIGNPPYIQLQQMKEEAEILQDANYDTYSKSGDIYCLFYEQGNKLLKQNATLCYITSNSWMKTKYGKPLRQYFSTNTNPVKLLNFEDTRIFQTAVVETNILLTKRAINIDKFRVAAIKSDYRLGTPLEIYFDVNSFEVNELDENGWIISGRESMLLKSQMEKVGIPLKDWEIDIYIGILNGFNDAFLIKTDIRDEFIKKNKKCDELIKPILRGRDLKKYSYKWDELWLINSHNGIKKNGLERIQVERDFPEVYNYFLPYKTELEIRQNKGDHWTNLRNCAYFLEFEKPKIIWGELSDVPKFAYDEKGLYAEATLFAMTGKNLKYLLGILNSRIALWYFNQITTTFGMGTSRWKKYKIEQFPVPKISDNETLDVFERLTDFLIFLNDDKKPSINPYTDNASISTVFEDVLNMMVYELYFEEHMKKEKIDVLKIVKCGYFPKLKMDDNSKFEDAKLLGEVYKILQEQDNPIRNRIILSNIRSKDIIRRINSTTH